MPEIKSIKDGTVINRNPPLFPGNDATTGAAVGSPSMNGIRWTRASSGSGKLASFFELLLFPPFFLCLWKFPLHMCVRVIRRSAAAVN